MEASPQALGFSYKNLQVLMKKNISYFFLFDFKKVQLQKSFGLRLKKNIFTTKISTFKNKYFFKTEIFYKSNF